MRYSRNETWYSNEIIKTTSTWNDMGESYELKLEQNKSDAI